MPVEKSPVVLNVLSVFRNGHNNPDGTPVRGVKLLTDQGVKEMWSDQEGNGSLVDSYIKFFNRGRERLTDLTQ